MKTRKLIGSVDIGGTKTIVAIITPEGEILKKRKFATILSKCDRTFDLCCLYIRHFLEEESLTINDLYGIGINVPGMYDAEKDLLLKAPFASWENIMVKEYFQKKLDFEKIYVENDVKNCALGEMYFGFGEKYRNYVWITVSTGIGGAIVQDGKVLYGNNNLAGEIGHVKIEYTNPRKCTCGERGCLEAYGSGTAIGNIVQKKMKQSRSFRQEFEKRGLPADAQGCAALAKTGLEDACNIYEKTGDYLARGIAVAVNLINPQAVILGGGVVESIDLWLPSVKRNMNHYIVESLRHTPVIQTALGYEAGVFGAAAFVLASRR